MQIPKTRLVCWLSVAAAGLFFGAREARGFDVVFNAQWEYLDAYFQGPGDTQPVPMAVNGDEIDDPLDLWNIATVSLSPGSGAAADAIFCSNSLP